MTTTRALIRSPHERFRAEYRDRNDLGAGWRPGTVVYQGERLAVIALDDGTTRHVYDWNTELRDLGTGTGALGDRVASISHHGTQTTGQLDVCHACAGHGLLFIPDPQQPEITAQHPDTQDLTTEAYQLLERIELSRHHAGVYLVGRSGEPWMRPYVRSEHGSWFAVADERFTPASMDALVAAGLITVSGVVTDADLAELPGLLLKALHTANEGRSEIAWEGLTIYRPVPTSNPYDKPVRADMEPVLRAALNWLYKTEQPTGAMVSHHGYQSGDLPTIPTRRIGMVTRGANGFPIINISVAHPVKTGLYAVRNPLAPGELDQWADVARDLGYDVVQVFASEGAQGGIELAEAPHPSLLAAVKLRAQGCLTHTKPVNGEPQGDVFCGCGCGWSQAPSQLAVPPTFPEPITS